MSRKNSNDESVSIDEWALKKSLASSPGPSFNLGRHYGEAASRGWNDGSGSLFSDLDLEAPLDPRARQRALAAMPGAFSAPYSS